MNLIGQLRDLEMIFSLVHLPMITLTLQMVVGGINGATSGLGHTKDLQKLSKSHFEFSIDLYRQTALHQEFIFRIIYNSYYFMDRNLHD